MTVQKNLKQLKTDCERVVDRVGEALAEDRARKAQNTQRTLQGLLLTLLTLLAAGLMGLVLGVRFVDTMWVQLGLGDGGRGGRRKGRGGKGDGQLQLAVLPAAGFCGKP